MDDPKAILASVIDAMTDDRYKNDENLRQMLDTADALASTGMEFRPFVHMTFDSAYPGYKVKVVGPALFVPLQNAMIKGYEFAGLGCVYSMAMSSLRDSELRKPDRNFSWATQPGYELNASTKPLISIPVWGRVHPHKTGSGLCLGHFTSGKDGGFDFVSYCIESQELINRVNPADMPHDYDEFERCDACYRYFTSDEDTGVLCYEISRPYMTAKDGGAPLRNLCANCVRRCKWCDGYYPKLGIATNDVIKCDCGGMLYP